MLTRLASVPAAHELHTGCVEVLEGGQSCHLTDRTNRDAASQKLINALGRQVTPVVVAPEEYDQAAA